MFTRWIRPCFALSVFSGAFLLGQQSPASSAGDQEFPVVFHENMVAGKTPAGTKIQAKLSMATLVHGVVLPQGAVLSGEVVESVAKTKSEPSKLAVRIDSAQWKSGSAALKVYLVGWFYPFISQNGQELQYGPQQPATRTWNGMGEYPAQNSHVDRPFPSGDSDSNSPSPTSNSVTSSHRVRMKNVETDRNADGTVTLVSSHSNIKLDRITTYVLANSELLAIPAKPAAK